MLSCLVELTILLCRWGGHLIAGTQDVDVCAVCCELCAVVLDLIGAPS